MSKKFSFEFVPFTYDQIKEMNSDDLHFNIIKFKRLIREARKSGLETLPFEREFCYLDNERQMRTKFEKAHYRNR